MTEFKELSEKLDETATLTAVNSAILRKMWQIMVIILLSNLGQNVVDVATIPSESPLSIGGK